MIFEEVPPPVQTKPPKTRDVFGIATPVDDNPRPPIDDDEKSGWLDYREPTLRLDGKSVRVMQVTAVRYSYDTRYVSRSRFEKKEEQEKRELDLSTRTPTDIASKLP